MSRKSHEEALNRLYHRLFVLQWQAHDAYSTGNTKEEHRVAKELTAVRLAIAERESKMESDSPSLWDHEGTV